MYLMYRTAIQHDTAQKAIHHVDDVSRAVYEAAGRTVAHTPDGRAQRPTAIGRKAVPIAAVHSSRPAAPPAATFAGVAGADTHGTPSQAAAPACAAELSSRRAREHVSRACCAMAVWPRCQEARTTPSVGQATRSRGLVSPIASQSCQKWKCYGLKAESI